MRIYHDEEATKFVAEEDDGTYVGSIVYSRQGPELISATHTWVDPQFRGKGMAGKLVDALVGYARENATKITPVCPYVVEAFAKHPEKYRDVAAE